MIAIIAVLVALLMPALTKARKRGREAVCMNNLRQLWMGHMLYVDDYNGRTCFTQYTGSELGVWPVKFLRRYFPQVGAWRASSHPTKPNSWSGRADVYYCPEDPRDPTRFSTATSSSYRMYYGWGWCTVSPPISYTPQDWAALKDPAFLLFLWCKGESGAVAGSGLAATTLSNWHVDPWATPAAFADGHVERIRFAGYLKDYKFPPAINPIYSGVTCP